MTNISERVLKNIQKKEITPKPKWIFTLHNLAIWFSSFVFLLIGGFAFSVVIYMIRENDWSFYENINDSLIEFILVTLPYFWIVILLGLVALAHYNLKRTKSGYKYRLRTIVVFVLFVSMMIGSGLYAAGMGKAIDETIADKVPLYEKFVNKINRDKMMWGKPGHGLLGGVIISLEGNNRFRIIDFKNDVWNVISDKNTEMRGFDMNLDHGVKIVGNEINDLAALSQGERAFQAKIIKVMPGRDWLRRHPMKDKRAMEMRADIGRRAPTRSSIMHMEYKEPTPEELAEMAKKECRWDKDCLLPFTFAARSNCPFESRCIEDKCRVICQMPYETRENDLNKVSQCKHNDDCNCAFYEADDKKECLCLREMCAVIVE